MKNLSAPQAKIEKTPKDCPIADSLGVLPSIQDVQHVSEANSARPSGVAVALHLHSLNLQSPGNEPKGPGQLDQRT
jgi:hypothetical protein